MKENIFDLLLTLAFICVLLNVISIAILRKLVSKNHAMFTQLFTTGSVHPYSMVTSLRIKFLLPWVKTPNFERVGKSAHFMFITTRLITWFAVGLVVAMFAIMASYGWA